MDPALGRPTIKIGSGESVPVEKCSTPVAAAAAVGDRRSMLWSGTLITQGTARGLVVATGTGTEIEQSVGLLHDLRIVFHHEQ